MLESQTSNTFITSRQFVLFKLEIYDEQQASRNGAISR